MAAVDVFNGGTVDIVIASPSQLTAGWRRVAIFMKVDVYAAPRIGLGHGQSGRSGLYWFAVRARRLARRRSAGYGTRPSRRNNR